MRPFASRRQGEMAAHARRAAETPSFVAAA